MDQSTLAQYHQYNQPYRSFSRFCHECEHELVVSKVNRAAIGLPASSLLPLFDKVLVDLKTLLTRAELNVDEPSASQSSPSTSTIPSSELPARPLKQRWSPSTRDEAARKIVQRFTDDYRSYCSASLGIQQSLPSRAQSYLSSLASRALGASFTQPVSLPSTHDPSSNPLQPLQQTDSSSSFSLEAQLIQASQSRSNLLNTLGSAQSISTHLQRKQHWTRTSGVLEIYRPLITSLLDLFELRQKEHDDPGTRSHISMIASETGNGGTVRLALSIRTINHEQSPANRNASNGMSDTDILASANETTNVSTTTDSTGKEKKGSMPTIRSRQSAKTTHASRPKIVTRAESRRQAEIKRSLVQLSKQLSSIETRPEQWKELQFLHVRWLRWDFW